MSEPINIATHILRGTTDGPHLLITGGVHGDEYEPMAAIRRLIREIDPTQLRGRVTLAPVVNESAFERRHRCGADGLDLARTFPGDPNGSITQRTAHAVAALIRSADYYIDLHTGGAALTIYPLAGYMLHTDSDVLATQRDMARAFNLPVVWGTDASLQGRSLSVARDANIPAIYAEYGGGGTFNPDAVDAYVEGCLHVMAMLGMLDRPAPPSRVAHIVEDSRPNSGYLQVQHPAPMAGFFTPCVALGDAVKRGDVLGSVCDVLGTSSEPVTANEDGIVLLLHTVGRVEAREALAVILPTNLATPASDTHRHALESHA